MIKRSISKGQLLAEESGLIDDGRGCVTGCFTGDCVTCCACQRNWLPVSAGQSINYVYQILGLRKIVYLGRSPNQDSFVVDTFP